MSKILIDDGTFEAVLMIKNHLAKDIFKLGDLNLGEIKEQVMLNGTFNIFDKFSQKSILPKNFLENIYPHKYIGFVIPYSKVSTKVTQDTNYNTLFKNLKSNEDNFKDIANNLFFINGDIVVDSFMSEQYAVPRPLLKLLHFESI